MEGSLGNLVARVFSPADRTIVENILRSEPLFRDPEVEVALELFDLGVGVAGQPPSDADYRWTGIERDGLIVGCACYGPTPGTEGTFDLYWIAVAAAARGLGVGRRLMDHVAQTIADRGGRLLVIETSGSPSYEGTRAFYRSCGCELLARIRDFYAPGEDRMIYASLPSLALAAKAPDE